MFENGLKAVKKDSEGLFDRVVEGIEHVFHRKSKLPRSRFSKKHSSRSMLELGHSSKKGAEDSDDSDAELLGPDGQLPYQCASLSLITGPDADTISLPACRATTRTAISLQSRISWRTLAESADWSGSPFLGSCSNGEEVFVDFF